MSPADNCAGDGGDNYRGEGGKGIMANDDFQREEDAGDGGVERSRDGRRDAAAQQSTAQMGREAEAPGRGASNGGAQMHHWTLPPGRGASAQGDDAYKGRGQAITQTHMAITQGHGLDHMGHPHGASPRHDELQE